MAKEFVLPIDSGEFHELAKMYQAVSKSVGAALAKRAATESIHAMFMRRVNDEATHVIRALENIRA